jgi:HEAT repeat protein
VHIARRIFMRSLVALLCCGLPALGLAQGTPRPGGPPEAGDLARGWALLASGDAAKAATIAGELLARHPRSVAALALAVDAEVTRGGALAGLTTYERWVEGKATEDGYVLRRVATALLVEAARGNDRGAKQQAIEALAADGDTRLTAELVEMPAAAPDPASPGADAPENAELMALLARPMVNKTGAIAALARTKSPRAAKAIAGVLNDPDPVTRAAAAAALGDMGATSAAAALKPLLQDPVFTVRLRAAGSLVALNDSTPLPWLHELLASEHAAIRLEAARVLRGNPDPTWMDIVRSLTSDADPEVRRQAAELLAPHDPTAARATLEPLLGDANPAQREAAIQSFVQYVATDFALLRRYFRGAENGVRIRAAARVLELTR